MVVSKSAVGEIEGGVDAASVAGGNADCFGSRVVEGAVGDCDGKGDAGMELEFGDGEMLYPGRIDGFRGCHLLLVWYFLEFG